MASADEGDPEELRIVLLGISESGKSSIGNAILGGEAFSETRTIESEKQRGRKEDRNLSIIDTPGFFNPHLTDEELQEQMMKSFFLSHPGPHIFLLVINLKNFLEDDRDIVNEIRENFGVQALRFTIVLFTGREEITKRKWTHIMETLEFQKLVLQCGGHYHVINSKNEIVPPHITKLFKKIDETVKHNDGQHYGTIAAEQQLIPSDLRIVLVGKTGAGKSTTGNTILRQKVFKEDFSTESVTNQCQLCQWMVETGKIISVVDTPGLCDTSMNKESLKEEILRCVAMSAPGPHAFLLVIRMDVPHTDEEKNTVKWIQQNFGEEAAHYTIVLFTRGDQLDKPLEDFLTENKQIKDLVEQCKGGYHVFNNKDGENQSQVTELLEKIDGMVKENGGDYYTNEMYQEAQRKIWERQREESERQKLEEEEINSKLYKVKKALKVGAGVAGGVVGGVVATAGYVALVPVSIAAAPIALVGLGGAYLVEKCTTLITNLNKDDKDQKTDAENYTK